MKFYTAKEFIDIVREGYTPLTYSEFRKTPYIENLWNKLDSGDFRRQYFKTVDNFYQWFYDFLLDDAPLIEFFNERLCDLKYKEPKILPILDNTVKIVPSSGRFLRLINLPSILKCSGGNGNSIIEYYKNSLLYGKNFKVCTIPSVIKTLVHNDYTTFVVTLKTDISLPSIYSPNVYLTLVANIISVHNINKPKILTPTASWCSPVLALKNLNLTALHVLDVQQDVLSVCEDLGEYLDSKKTLFDATYPVKTFCCPSEKMSTVVDNDYDIIFFCPPYFDLEIYGASEEQSTTLYSTYEDWLNGYWLGTVNEAYKVLKPGAIFSFTMGHYINGRYLTDDMIDIAKQKFTYISETKINPKIETTRKLNYDIKHERCIVMQKSF